ncbi:MAG: 4Fe-4S dicluster domain-containing protein [Candidatus Methanospirareceae archaeon]
MKGIFIDLERCVGCKSCEIYCAVEHSSSKELFTAISETPPPVKRINVEVVTMGEVSLPLQCRHCEEAPCVDTCPSGALDRDLERGIVVHERDRCIGCWMCAVVCPFGVIIPEKESKIVLKCDRCPDLEMPACVTACPTKALIFGDLGDIMKERRKKVASIVLSAVKKEIKIGGVV